MEKWNGWKRELRNGRKENCFKKIKGKINGFGGEKRVRWGGKVYIEI